MKKDNVGIHVGTTMKKSQADLLTKSILKILDSNAGDVVKQKALETLTTVFEVKNVTVSGCNIKMGR